MIRRFEHAFPSELREVPPRPHKDEHTWIFPERRNRNTTANQDRRLK